MSRHASSSSKIKANARGSELKSIDFAALLPLSLAGTNIWEDALLTNTMDTLQCLRIDTQEVTLVNLIFFSCFCNLSFFESRISHVFPVFLWMGNRMAATDMRSEVLRKQFLIGY